MTAGRRYHSNVTYILYLQCHEANGEFFS